MIELPDFKQILLEVFDYPEYARVEYLKTKQKQSEWSKALFFNGLNYSIEELHSWIINISIAESHIQANANGAEQFINEKKFYQNKIKEFIHDKTNVHITKDTLNDLRFYVQKAFITNNKTAFTSLHVIALAEICINFIITEFEIQLNKRTWPFRWSKKKTAFQLYHYSVITNNAPLFDFNKLKLELRTLILNSRNKNELKDMLKPCFKKCLTVVKLWNEELYNAERKRPPYQSLEEASFDIILLEFNLNNFSFSERIQPEPKELFKNGQLQINNEKLAQFAANVANLISSEVLKEDTPSQTIIETPTEKIIKDFLNDYKDKMAPKDYNNLINAYTMYFDKNIFPRNFPNITVGKVNIKKFGWTLNQMYRRFKTDKLSVDYLKFAKEKISTFENTSFDENDLFNCTLYDYFTTKTK